jgi:hypothetical protein
MSKEDSIDFFATIKDVIFECLIKDNSVEIENLGLFEVVNHKYGNQKLIFTPADTLKKRINKPFEHLKAIEIDAEKTEIPLTKLSQQADEIKGILTDIQNINVGEKIVEQTPIIEKTVKEFENETVEPKVVDIPKVEQQQPMSVEQKLEPNNHQQSTNFFSRQLETPPEVKANTFDYIPTEKYNSKKNMWWLWLLMVFLLTVGCFGVYYFCNPVQEFCKSIFAKNVITIEADTDVISNTGATQVVENDSVASDISLVEESAQDTISIFDKERKYTEFIEQKPLEYGNTLIKIARKHYGNGDFWVYIYEANKERITNPNNVSAGTLIKVPKLDTKLIDDYSVEAINYAKKLQQKYLN